MCKRKHNSPIHVCKDDNKEQRSLTVSTCVTNEILLSTAIVTISGSNSDKVCEVRYLLDSGSQSSFISNSHEIRRQLSKFWELEEVSSRPKMSQEEEACEEHFVRHTCRLPDGRFCVTLPLKIDPRHLACVYVRSADALGNITVRLLCAKAKVKPLKAITIPRMELCGALLAARLYDKVKKALRITIDQVQFWCDSKVVLDWLKISPQKLTCEEDHSHHCRHQIYKILIRVAFTDMLGLNKRDSFFGLSGTRSGSSIAIRELPRIAQQLGLDFVLVQKQYSNVKQIQVGKEPKAGVMLTRTDVALTRLAQLSIPHCLVAHMASCDLYAISRYYQNSDRIDPHLDHFGRVLNLLHVRRIVIYIELYIEKAFCSVLQHMQSKELGDLQTKAPQD
ncbi:hypothetical protein EVAR_57639_1 [Eumeta japonica]|uniref:Peptidase aspartic putative domain-containing protein n=1 Tax=Eumeta variegata TaxID=151549 RepID=A0A4C1ZNZ8_EUMVA|nr:hypothetical protein EVAR_57639_1 [Eumeta japonica]